MKFNVKHKIRFDRGRAYYSYFNAVITALLVWIYSNNNMVSSVIASVTTVILIYAFGCFDDWFKIINREQELYSKKNKVIMDIYRELEKINKKLTKIHHK